MRGRLFAAVAAIALAGCASVEPNLPPEARIEAKAGYVAAVSYSTTAKNFSVVIQNTATGKQYGLPLGASLSELPTLVDKVTTIKVPPGSYQIVGWTNGGGVRAWTSRAGADSPLARTFPVGEGAVVALGRFVVDSNRINKYIYVETYSAIHVSRASRTELRDAFHGVCVAMQDRPFSCFLCSE